MHSPQSRGRNRPLGGVGVAVIVGVVVIAGVAVTDGVGVAVMVGVEVSCVVGMTMVGIGVTGMDVEPGMGVCVGRQISAHTDAHSGSDHPPSGVGAQGGVGVSVGEGGWKRSPRIRMMTFIIAYLEGFSGMTRPRPGQQRL